MRYMALGCVLALSCAGPVQAAGVFKWVDERGVVQYTGTPPPAGVPYEVMRRGRTSATLVPGSRSPALAADPDDSEYLDDDATMAPDADAEAAALAGDQPDRSALFTRNCATARSNLQMLESDQPVVIRDSEGRAALIGDEERAQRIEDARRDIEYYCRESASAE